MQMNIELSCSNCTRDVYRAIGEFLAADAEEGLSNIVSVDVFESESEIDGKVGVCVEWDVHPCRRQIALFRNVWMQHTNYGGVVILHDAPSTIVDQPPFCAEFN